MKGGQERGETSHTCLASTQPYNHVTHTSRLNRDHHHGKVEEPSIQQTGYASPTAIMRTYDDTFSGQKIYPGKVCLFYESISPASPELRYALHNTQQQQLNFHIYMEQRLTGKLAELCLLPRASFTFAATARYSAFRTAKPSLFSYSARTLVALRGLYYSGGSIRRVSQR